MTINLKVVNAIDGSSMSVELEEHESVGDILDYASQFWGYERNAFVMKIGNKLLSANGMVGDLGLKDSDSVVLVPDPQGG